MVVLRQKYLHLNDVASYKKSFMLSNIVWDIVNTWNQLSKNTVGQQFIRAVDSISANIAEGFGRFHKKDKQRFYYNARGSVYEALDWLQKAKNRNLISDNEYKQIYQVLIDLPKEINALISWTQDHLTK